MSHSYSPEKTKRLGIRVLAVCSGQSLTQQHHKEACDIGRIIGRYRRTGEFPPAKHPPVYGDVTHLQGDVTERREHASSVINKANSDIVLYQQKLLSDKQKLLSDKQQKQKQQILKNQRISDLEEELSLLKPPASSPNS